MTTFYSEVQDNPEVDYDSVTGQYLDFAVFGSLGNGDTLTDIVKGEVVQFTDADAQGNSLVFDADGSYRQALNSASSNYAVNTGMVSGVIDSKINDKTLMGNSDYVIVIDYKSGGHTGNRVGQVINSVGGSSGDTTNVFVGTYGGGSITSLQQANWVSSQHSTTSLTGRNTLALHFSAVGQSMSHYEEGELKLNTSYTSKPAFATDPNITLGAMTELVGSGIYSISIFFKDNDQFTQAEIDEIVSNPYSSFKTAEDKREEYALTLGASNQGIELQGVTATTTANIEIELASDLSDPSGDDYLIDCRRESDGISVGSGSARIFTQGGNLNVGSDITNLSVDSVLLSEFTVTELIDKAKAGSVISVDFVPSGDLMMVMSNWDCSQSWFGNSIKSIKVTDDNGTRLWIFDRKDNPSVVLDEYNNAPATLVGNPTFEPVIEKQVYLVKADGSGDYTGLEIAKTDNAGDLVLDNTSIDFLMDGSFSETDVRFDNYTTSDTCNITVKGLVDHGYLFGVGAKITFEYAAYGIIGRGQHVHFENLEIESNPVKLWSTSVENVTAKNMLVNIVQGGGGFAGKYISDSILVIQDGVISNALDGSSSGTVSHNCVAVALGNSGSHSSNIVARNMGAGTSNLVVYKETESTAYDAVTGDVDYSVCSEGKLGENSLEYADFTGAFVDRDNMDFRLNQDWADTYLVGKGWNGSDIAPMFYASVAQEIAVALSGSITSATELDIQTGGNTIVLTLSGDIWATGSNFDSQRQALINGITSVGSEVNGWNNEVRDTELVTSVERTSDNIITITLSTASMYDITQSEEVFTVVPSAILSTGTSDVNADVSFVITPTASGGFKVVWAINSNNLIGDI